MRMHSIAIVAFVPLAEYSDCIVSLKYSHMHSTERDRAVDTVTPGSRMPTQKKSRIPVVHRRTLVLWLLLYHTHHPAVFELDQSALNCFYYAYKGVHYKS